MAIVGIPERERLSFSAEVARRNELRFMHVRRQNECMKDAIDMVENGDVDVSFMITHRFSLNETVKAFDLVEKYDDGVIKAMIEL